MGWWITDEEGHSLQDEGDLVWGDGPADAMGDALARIDKEFEAAYGRKPSLAELVAGLKFSALVEHE